MSQQIHETTGTVQMLDQYQNVRLDNGPALYKHSKFSKRQDAVQTGDAVKLTFTVSSKDGTHWIETLENLSTPPAAQPAMSAGAVAQGLAPVCPNCGLIPQLCKCSAVRTTPQTPNRERSILVQVAFKTAFRFMQGDSEATPDDAIDLAKRLITEMEALGA